MATYTFPIDDEMVKELEESFFQGPIIDDQGRRLLTEEEVDRLNGMSVQIQSDEHPPPHFHVMFAGQNASFAIATGRRLAGIKGLERYDRNIFKWWKKNKCELIHAWNRLRPSDCPVGTISVPKDCLTQYPPTQKH